MRNIFAALLLLASAPLTRQKMIEDVVRFSRAEEIEHAAIAAVIDALADNATDEEKKTLQRLRARALAHETGDLWVTSFDHAFDDAALAKLHEFYVSPAANRMTQMQAGLLQDHMRERLSTEPTARQRDRRLAMRTMADMHVGRASARLGRAEARPILPPDRQQYRILSAGADAKVDVRLTDRYEDDLVFENGQFVQVPRDIVERERD